MAFFNPLEVSGPGIECYLRGLASQVDQRVDSYIVDGLRNFLFGPPGAGGFDLASLNIRRNARSPDRVEVFPTMLGELQPSA